MDTVSKVAVVAERGHSWGVWMTTPVSITESWPLFDVCTTLLLGWNENPLCYHSLSEVKAPYQRSWSITVLGYIDDA